jgi:hypothetical protein
MIFMQSMDTRTSRNRDDAHKLRGVVKPFCWGRAITLGDAAAKQGPIQTGRPSFAKPLVGRPKNTPLGDSAGALAFALGHAYRFARTRKWRERAPAITRSDLGERGVCSARGIRNQCRNDGSRTHQPIMEISCGNSSKFARPGLPAAPYRFQRPRVQLPEISSMLVDAERTLSEHLGKRRRHTSRTTISAVSAFFA